MALFRLTFRANIRPLQLGLAANRLGLAANSLQTSAPAQILCKRLPCCVRRGVQRSPHLMPVPLSAGGAFRRRRGGRRLAVAQRDAGGQELAMEFVRPPRGELPVEKRPDFGGTDVE